MRRRGLKGERERMRGGGREDNLDNELSIETKAELCKVIMILILRKVKFNNDEASLMRLIQQFRQNLTTFS